jgi:hypothetical protein
MSWRRYLIASSLTLAGGCSEQGPSVAGGGAAAGAGSFAGGSGTAGGSEAGSNHGGDRGAVGGASGGAGAGHGGIGTECAAPVPRGDGIVHPGGLHLRSDLERMRFQVQAGVEPWLTSFQRLSNDARAQVDYAVRGDPTWTQLERGGLHGPEFESDATAAYLNALMWAITGDEAHARKCVEIFDAWRGLTAVVAGGTPPLDAGLYAYKLVEAAEIIQSTYPGWSAESRQAFEDMLVYPGYSSSAVPETLSPTNGTFYWRIYNGDPGRHGNQDLIAWRAMLTMGVLLDNRVMLERALRYFKGEAHRPDDLAYAPGPSVSGAELDDNPYFTTYERQAQNTEADYGYNGVLEHYVWENGQLQESSRDQQHAMFGLGIACGIAEVAWHQGDGVYNALEDRLLLGFEFTARYNASARAAFADQPQPWEPTAAELIERTDRTGRWRSKTVNPHFESDFVGVSRGDFPGKRPIFEQPLAHYQVRMNRPESATLWTERARDLALELYGHEPNGFSLDHPGWGALTFRRPGECAGDPLSGFIDGVPQFGLPVIPGAVLLANYDYFPIAGELHTYHDTSPGNSGGAYRDEDVDLGCGPDGDPVVTQLQAGEWLAYTLAVPAAGTHSLELRYRASSESALRLRVDGTDVEGERTLPSTGGEWTTQLAAQGLSLRAGVQALRITIGSVGEDLELHSFVLRPD